MRIEDRHDYSPNEEGKRKVFLPAKSEITQLVLLLSFICEVLPRASDPDVTNESKIINCIIMSTAHHSMIDPKLESRWHQAI